MSSAVIAGLAVLICAGAVVADVVVEHLRRASARIDERHAAEDSHRNLMRELGRHD